MKKYDIQDLKNCLHYLGVLNANSSVYQPEIRRAIMYAIDILTEYIEAIR